MRLRQTCPPVALLAGLLATALAQSHEVPTRAHLQVGFEWELDTKMVQLLAGCPSHTVVRETGTKGIPLWTTHADIGGLKWTGDLLQAGAQTIELITGPLHKNQIAPMVNAMKADLELINAPGEGTSRLSPAGPFKLDKHMQVWDTFATVEQEEAALAPLIAGGHLAMTTKGDFCSMSPAFPGMPDSIFLTGVKPSENLYKMSQHVTLPVKFGSFHTTHTNQFSYDLMAVVTTIATDIGFPDNDQLKDALYMAAALLSTEVKTVDGRWSGVNHRKLGLAPRVAPTDLFHLIEDPAVRAAVVAKRAAYSAVARPAATPTTEADMVKMVKHSFSSPNFFAKFDSEFGEGSDEKVCTQVRTGDAAYRTPFRHNGELYFLVEDRQQVLIPKCERLDDMLAAFDRVFAGNYRAPRAARAVAGSSAGLLAGLLRNDRARRNARQ